MRFKLGMLLGLGSTVVVAIAGCTASTPASTPLTTTSVDQYVARGKYLADIGECISCHTPIGAQGPVMAKIGEGGNAWFDPSRGIGISPNLTPYDGSKVKTLDAPELAEYWAEVSSLKLPDGQYAPKLIGPMPALAKYEKEDLKAIAYYFKGLQGKAPTNPALKSFSFLEAAASASMQTKWPYPAGQQADSQGTEIPGLFEGPANLTLNQAKVTELINAASASAATAH
ncbi:MAG TPA: hypothetical protein V6D00_11690 [Pantanalinema sp.]